MENNLNSLKFCEEAAQLTELWLNLPRATGEICPAKSDFQPMKMRQHLRSVVLYERLKDGQIIARVAGTSIEQFLGSDITGQNVMEVYPPEFVRAYHNYYLNLAEHPCAGVVERPMRGAGGSAYLIRTLQLPMLNRNGEVSHFVGVAKSYPLPKQFTDYRSAAMTASRNLEISYFDIGAGVPEDHMETTMVRGAFA